MMTPTDKILPRKAAVYIRVSTQFQIDKDSLQVQRRELIAYSELVLGITDHEIFEDPGYSGKNTDRPAYQQMLRRIHAGEFSHLLVWKIDRISRNLLDFAERYSGLKKIGVTFVSKNEQFDTSTAIGEAMLKIILVFAELERQMTAERVTAVMLSRANNGQWNGGRVPFGYTWNAKDKTFSINPDEAEVVQLIYDLYEEKQSLLSVCDYLNSHGYRTKTGSLWSPTGVSIILKSVFYLGTYRYNVHSDGRGIKKRNASDWIDIENHHPAMIDDIRFDHFQFLLSKNRKKYNRRSGSTREVVHIYSGLIVCGNCGRKFSASQDKKRADGWRPSIYGCTSRRKKQGQCSNKYINDVYLSPFVFCVISKILNARQNPSATASVSSLEQFILSNSIFSHVKHVDGLNELLAALKQGITGIEYSADFFSPKADASNAEVRNLRSQKRKCETAMRRLQTIFLYGDDGISESDYLSKRKEILTELESIDHKLSELGNAEERFTDEEFERKASYFIMVDKLLNFKAKPDETKKIIRSVEPSVLKSFLNQILRRITITDNRVSEMQFANRISIRFIYESENPE